MRTASESGCLEKVADFPCHPERSELASIAKDLTNNAGIVWEILRKLRMT